jgi:hypothetical protein
VNADRGPSVDSGLVSKDKKAKAGVERLAHRACNTRRGKVAPVVPWSSEIFVVDPAPLVAVVDRLSRKGGQEVVARCPSQADADEAATWLIDRLSRFAPDLALSTKIDPGGGQFLLVLRAV